MASHSLRCPAAEATIPVLMILVGLASFPSDVGAAGWMGQYAIADHMGKGSLALTSFGMIVAGTYSDSLSGGQSVWVAGILRSADILWARSLHPEMDAFRGMHGLSDGTALLVFQDPSGRIKLLDIDEYGETIWGKRLEIIAPGPDAWYGPIIPLDQGAMVLGGVGNDSILIHLGPQGEVVWARIYQDVELVNAGNAPGGRFWAAGSGWPDGLVLELDGLGNPERASQISFSDETQMCDYEWGVSGSHFIGYREDGSRLIAGDSMWWLAHNYCNHFGWLLVMDADGQVRKARAYKGLWYMGGSYGELVLPMENDGSVIVRDGGTSGNYHWPARWFKFDAEGMLVWGRGWGRGYKSEITQMVPIPEGGLAFVGWAPIDVDAMTGALVAGWEPHPEWAAGCDIQRATLEPYEGYTYALTQFQVNVLDLEVRQEEYMDSLGANIEVSSDLCFIEENAHPRPLAKP